MDAKSPGRVFKTGYKRAVNIYLAPDLREHLEVIAERETRSLTAQVEHFLKAAIAADMALSSTHTTTGE